MSGSAMSILRFAKLQKRCLDVSGVAANMLGAKAAVLGMVHGPQVRKLSATAR
jgi:hypothetical protein